MIAISITAALKFAPLGFQRCHAVGVIEFNGKSILSAHTESNKGTSEGDGLETAKPVKNMVNGLDLLPVISVNCAPDQ
jgi:hypothetical protein